MPSLTTVKHACMGIETLLGFTTTMEAIMTVLYIRRTENQSGLTHKN